MNIKLSHLPILSLCLLTACGGTGAPPVPGNNWSGNAKQFNNQTSASQAQLYAIWQFAQNQLAYNPIDLDAATHPGINVRPPDMQALQEQPNGLSVVAVPDLTVAQLQAENPGVTLQHNTDPTGVIHCAGNIGGSRYCVSYVSNGAVYVATSQVLNDNATGWEFENVILARLGFNTDGR